MTEIFANRQFVELWVNNDVEVTDDGGELIEVEDTYSWYLKTLQLVSDLVDTNTGLDTATASIDNLETLVQSNTGALSLLENTLTNLQGQFSTLQSAVSVAQQATADNAEEIVNLQNQVTTLESSLSNFPVSKREYYAVDESGNDSAGIIQLGELSQSTEWDVEIDHGVKALGDYPEVTMEIHLDAASTSDDKSTATKS